MAGLTDLLHQLSSRQGPIRQVGDPVLRLEWRPIVLQAAQEHVAQDLTMQNEPRTTLVYLRFKPLSQWGKGVTVGRLVDGIRSAEDELSRAEAISAGIVAEVKRAAQQADSEEPA